MKKAFFVLVLTIGIAFLLSACSVSGYCNILLFTDRMNEISGEELSLEAYTIKDSTFRYVAQSDGARVLITCRENESTDLLQVGVSIAKLDEKGNTVQPDSKTLELYRKKVEQAIYAFTLFDKEKSSEICKKILPLKSEDFLREGELTMEADNFHLVYYSNKLCCRLTITDTYLEKTEVTQKPDAPSF